MAQEQIYNVEQDGRFPAVRVFARELDMINTTVKAGEDDQSARLAVLPTGRLANRVMMVGTLMEEPNDVTDDPDSEYWRARLVDNSGEDGLQNFFVYAGQYQPDARQFLKSVDHPTYLAVVGKPVVDEYEGDLYQKIRPESIAEVDEQRYDLWVNETAQHTISSAIDLHRDINGQETDLDPELVDIAEEAYPNDEYLDVIDGVRGSLESAVREE